MNKLIAALLATICSFSFAQSGVSPNLIGQQNLTGTTTYSGTGGGYSGGSTPGYNSTTNTIYFGYTQSQVAYTYAFSQALQNSGMTITGYNYSWDYYNQGYSAGNLSAKVNFAGTNGTSLYSKSWTLGTTTDWTNVTGTETFTSPGLLAANIANFSLSFNGKDNRFWAGYYGPMVKNPSLSLNYTFDACSSNPLSSPDCPGYAAAYLTQQCNANPLYNPSCPGYAAANFTQQCSINSLYDPNCPSYAVAYLNYQCSINPLYATTCQGYDQAYFNQQCNANPLYSKQCPGYAQAYALKNVVVTTPTTTTTQTTTTPTTDSSGKIEVAVIADPIVNQAVTSTATSASPAQAATATVPLVVTPSVTTTTTQSAATPAPVTSVEPPKEQPKTARQELQAKREAAAKSAAIEKGKNLANDMGKATDIESQKQIQNVVIAAMGFTPGFDNYGKLTVPDAVGYKPFTVYNNQKTVDNRKVGLGLYGPSDRLHNELVESQYK